MGGPRSSDGGSRIRTCVGISQRVYSPSPLTTRTSPRAERDSRGGPVPPTAGTAAPARGSPASARPAEPLRLGQRLELAQRVGLDLADALARHPEGAADLLERARLLAVEPVAHGDHAALALR